MAESIRFYCYVQVVDAVPHATNVLRVSYSLQCNGWDADGNLGTDEGISGDYTFDVDAGSSIERIKYLAKKDAYNRLLDASPRRPFVIQYL